MQKSQFTSQSETEDKKMSEKYVFGIDLGTTYSCISYFDENMQCTPCPSMEGPTTTPSVVRLEPDSEPVVGQSAKNTAVIYPDTTIQFVKSRIGKDASFNYGPDAEYTTTPIAVSAEILKKLANDAANHTNSDVKRVVITVPAYFGDPERKATEQAGIDAGFDVLGIIEEPTAAAIYYGMNKSDKPENILVFDLGGGTFDITAMKIEGNSFTTLTTEGDHDLGGKNWDNALIDLVKQKFEEQTGYDDSYDSDIEQDLLIACEQAKIVLSQALKASVPVSISREYRAAIEITREEFDDVTATLLDRAISLTRKVIERVSEPIDKILMVGGSTYMPQVREAIEREFPQLEIFSNEPNHSVSKGAAIFAFNKYVNRDPDEIKEKEERTTSSGEKAFVSLEEEIDTYKGIVTLENEINIVTVATKSLGVRILLDGVPKINNLILKDTQLPASVSATYATNTPNATRIPIRIFQANNFDEYYDVDEDLQIGQAVLELNGDLPKGAPIEVTLSISDDGLIHVKGLDMTNNIVVEGDIENDAYTAR